MLLYFYLIINSGRYDLWHWIYEYHMARGKIKSLRLFSHKFQIGICPLSLNWDDLSRFWHVCIFSAMFCPCFCFDHGIPTATVFSGLLLKSVMLSKSKQYWTLTNQILKWPIRHPNGRHSFKANFECSIHFTKREFLCLILLIKTISGGNKENQRQEFRKLSKFRENKSILNQ